MKTATIQFLQEQLKTAGFNPGKPDGKLGNNTYRAVDAALRAQTAQLPGNWSSWPQPQKAIACLQLFCKNKKIEVGNIDGKWGPQTDFAVSSLMHLVEHGAPPPPWRDEEPAILNPHKWPSQADVERFYGPVGKNQVKIQVPYPHRLSWDLTKTILSFQCHEKVHDSLGRVLQRVLDHYGPERIRELRLDRWGGSLAVRKMRGGTRWSMHSWGIALDYDPDRNQLKWGRDRAAFAQPAYDVWWRLWEEEGWVSLGRAKNYDWMHVQAAKL